MFLDYSFMHLPGAADKSEFVLDYSLQVAIVIYLHVPMETYSVAALT